MTIVQHSALPILTQYVEQLLTLNLFELKLTRHAHVEATRLDKREPELI